MEEVKEITKEEVEETMNENVNMGLGNGAFDRNDMTIDGRKLTKEEIEQIMEMERDEILGGQRLILIMIVAMVLWAVGLTAVLVNVL